MQSQWLGHVSTVLYDTVHANRHLTRNSLFTLGFRDIDAPATVAELRRAFDVSDYDLCIIDVSNDEEELCGIIRELRHGRLGRNPFVVILTTTWNQSGHLVRQVIDAGADDLILRPLSTGQLKQRIRLQVEARKDFVVTSGYIGPDRRRDPSRSGGAPLVPVPNSLRTKAHDGNLTGVDLAEITEVRKQIDRRRVEQDAFQIGISARLVGELLVQPGFRPGSAANEQGRLLAAIEDLEVRVAACGFAAVTPLVASLIEARDAFTSAMAGPRPAGDAGKPLAVMGELARAIQLALDPRKDEPTLAREISSAVSQIKARHAAAAPGPVERRAVQG